VVWVRRAVPADAAELVRLRGVMLAEADGQDPAPGPWQPTAEETLRKRLSEPDPDATLAAFVVERPDEPGRLAACALGTIEQRLGDPRSSTGDYGYVFNVATDPGYRRRGYSRACMVAVLDWYRERGVRKIDLKATEAGEPLYRSLGFVRSLQHMPMRLAAWW
jgi:GNAT superfamily N-acetyltransferase